MKKLILLGIIFTIFNSFVIAQKVYKTSYKNEAGVK